MCKPQSSHTLAHRSVLSRDFLGGQGDFLDSQGASFAFMLAAKTSQTVGMLRQIKSESPYV